MSDLEQQELEFLYITEEHEIANLAINGNIDQKLLLKTFFVNNPECLAHLLKGNEALMAEIENNSIFQSMFRNINIIKNFLIKTNSPEIALLIYSFMQKNATNTNLIQNIQKNVLLTELEEEEGQVVGSNYNILFQVMFEKLAQDNPIIFIDTFLKLSNIKQKQQLTLFFNRNMDALDQAMNIYIQERNNIALHLEGCETALYSHFPFQLTTYSPNLMKDYLQYSYEKNKDELVGFILGELSDLQFEKIATDFFNENLEAKVYFKTRPQTIELLNAHPEYSARLGLVEQQLHL